MSPTDLLPIDDALAVVLEAVVALPSEPVPLAGADGRVLATDVGATLDLPPFTNSAMDGYALRSTDTPGRLAVAGESAAGRPFAGTVSPGQAVVISTGAVLPEGADAVIPIERVAVSDDGETVTVADVSQSANVRSVGSDLRRGDPLLGAGTLLGPAQIGAAASIGLTTLECGRRPSVAILTTGDELRPPGEPLGPGQIYDSNGPMLAAGIARTGARLTRIAAAADTPDAHRAALAAALEHDVVISTGGVSVGPHDLVRGIGAELGVQERFWRIRMRPGKPLSFGVRDHGDRTTLVFGLPGNPVSVLVTYELFVRPALLALQGARSPGPDFHPAPLATAVRRNAERDDMIRVALNRDGALEPVSGQQSHQLTAAARSDSLARIPAGTGELAAGSVVDYLQLH